MIALFDKVGYINVFFEKIMKKVYIFGKNPKNYLHHKDPALNSYFNIS